MTQINIVASPSAARYHFFMQRRGAVAVLSLLFAAVSGASTIKVSVPKLTFTDEPVAADVVVRVDDSAFRDLDARQWWKQLDWSLRDSGTKETRTIAPRSLGVVSASKNPIVVGATAQHRGVFRIGRLPAGNYVLRVAHGGIEASDAFAVRSGNENALVRERYLEREADRTNGWDAYKKIQLERAQLAPARADIWLNLAARSLESGTLQETTDAYDQAIAVMQKNLASYVNREPKMAKEARKRFAIVVASIHALEAELPYYFANRRRLQVVEEPVDGVMRYVIKERRGGRVDRVVMPGN